MCTYKIQNIYPVCFSISVSGLFLLYQVLFIYIPTSAEIFTATFTCH